MSYTTQLSLVDQLCVCVCVDQLVLYNMPESSNPVFFIHAVSTSGGWCHWVPRARHALIANQPLPIWTESVASCDPLTDFYGIKSVHPHHEFLNDDNLFEFQVELCKPVMLYNLHSKYLGSLYFKSFPGNHGLIEIPRVCTSIPKTGTQEAALSHAA